MNKYIILILIGFIFIANLNDFSSAQTFEIGGNFGAPAYFNAAAGYWNNRFGLRVSGMYKEKAIISVLTT